MSLTLSLCIGNVFNFLTVLRLYLLTYLLILLPYLQDVAKDLVKHALLSKSMDDASAIIICFPKSISTLPPLLERSSDLGEPSATTLVAPTRAASSAAEDGSSMNDDSFLAAAEEGGKPALALGILFFISLSFVD